MWSMLEGRSVSSVCISSETTPLRSINAGRLVDVPGVTDGMEPGWMMGLGVAVGWSGPGGVTVGRAPQSAGDGVGEGVGEGVMGCG